MANGSQDGGLPQPQTAAPTPAPITPTPAAPTPAFNVGAARMQGYSDDEILSHLSTSRNFRVDDALKSGYSKQELINYLASAPPITGAKIQSTAGMRAQPKPFTKEWLQSKFYSQVADPTLQALPQIGATAGGIAGGMGGSAAGPVGTAFGAMGGAGIGGMGGEAARQLLSRALGFEAPQTSAEAASQIGKQGMLQSALEIPGAILPGVAGGLQREAVSQYQRAIAPTTKINKAIAREITPELIQRGERGSLSQLQLRAEDQLARLNPELSAAYQAAGAGGRKITAAGTQVIADLEKMRQSYMPGGIVAKPAAVNAIEGVQNIINQYGADISPDNLRRLRQIFERVPGERGAFAIDIPTNYTLEAEEQASNSIRGILNREPDIGALNREMSFWMDVRRVVSESRLRQVGQTGGLAKALGGLASSAAGATATGLGLYGGAAPSQSLEAGLGTAVLTQAGVLMSQAMRSPAWRTTAAVVKDRVAQLLARGDVRTLAGVLSRTGLLAAQGPPQTNRQPVANAPAQ